MTTRILALARDVAGSATIELALTAPILGALLIGMVDLSMAFSNKLRLEQVAQQAIERVQQNGFTTGQEATLEAEAQAAAGTGSNADLTFWLECNGVRQASTAYTTGCTTPGDTYGRFVELVIVKTHTPIIAARFSQSNSDGTITVRGKAGIRIQ
jgi:Flp pilus assembly protein TadG